MLRSQRNIEEPRDQEDEPGGRSRSHPVRMSLLSREFFILLLFLGGTGYVVVGGADREAGQLATHASVRGHDTLLESVVYAPDGKTLISCGWDKQVRLWNMTEAGGKWGLEVGNLTSGSHLFTVVTTRDGRFLAAGGVGGFLVWEADGGGWNPIAHERGTSRRTLAFSPDGRWLALGGSEGSIRLWDVAARSFRQTYEGLTDDVRRIEFSVDGRYLAGNTFKGEFRIWELGTGRVMPGSGGELGRIQIFTFCKDDHTVAVAEHEERTGSLKLWDFREGSFGLELADNSAGVNTLVASPDGRVLASAGMDETIRFFDLATGAQSFSLGKEVGWVKTVAFSPDGRRLAYGGKSGAVHFHDLTAAGEHPRSKRS